jgi:hypothetical protein
MSTVSTIMPSSTHQRVSKLLPLLGSDKDGEVVAAARAIERTLRPTGWDWHTLATSIRTNPARAQPEKEDHRWSGRHWRSTAEWCAQHGEYLNEWELGFVKSLVRSRYRQLTEKQPACLESIQQKILHQSKHSNGDASEAPF